MSFERAYKNCGECYTIGKNKENRLNKSCYTNTELKLRAYHFNECLKSLEEFLCVPRVHNKLIRVKASNMLKMCATCDYSEPRIANSIEKSNMLELGEKNIF